MTSICKSDIIWNSIKNKFKTDSEGLYYNQRLEFEVEKRKKYTKSRRENAKKVKAYAKHMENENEIGNIIIDNRGDIKGGILELNENTVFDIWNTFAGENDLTKILELSDVRRNALKERFREKEFDLFKILDNIKHSDFLLGNKGWKADFDWLFGSKNNYLKVLEGKYKNGDIAAKSNGKGFNPDELAEAVSPGLKKYRL